MQYLKLTSAVVALMLMVFIVAPVRADDPFGGPVAGTSGNGTTSWGAIYVAEKCSPSVLIPARSARWFKADAWDDYKLQVWLDDDPLWGAAFKYFENYPDPVTSDQSENKLHGYWLRVYAPDSLNPNYAYGDQDHRADLLTTRDGIRSDGSEVTWVGYANNNKFVTDHLLWYEARFKGWVYLRVENKMQWDGKAVVCTHRAYSPRPQPQFQPTPSWWDNPSVDDGPKERVPGRGALAADSDTGR